MGKFFKSMCCLMLCVLFLLQSVQTVWATSQQDLQQKISQNQSQLNNISGQLSSLESQQDILDEQIDDANADLVNLYTSIDLLSDQITDKENQITKKTDEITAAQAAFEKAQQEEKDQYEAMKLRIKFMYEQGNSTYVELLLNSESFGDLLDKTEYVEDIYDYDRKMLKAYQDKKEQVAALKTKLESDKATLEADKTSLEADKSDLVNQQDYLNGVLNQKKAASANYDAEIAAAQKQAKAYKSQIASDNKKLTQMKADEKKRLAAQAAAQAAAAAKAAASQAGTSAQASAGTTTQATDTTAKKAAAQTNISSSSGSGTGKSIASYACQYVGNPYVAGGTSLTGGADCSGFIYRVYADFGYSVPRNSYALRTAGTGVSYSEAQPGDILCYEGHVAMYIGNGLIVHASSAKTGIKISNAQYREILAVRRIVS